MPKYLVDGVIHVKYKLQLEANNYKELMNHVDLMTAKAIMDEADTKTTNEINPTVEIIQEK